MVTEGLGTKNLVADELFKEIKAASQDLSVIANGVGEGSPRTHYDAIAQDTVAMIVNDLIVVGAMPKVITAHMSVGDSNWFNNVQRVNDLTDGWADACNMAGATWGGGETPTLKGILQPDVIELSGSAMGEINPASRLTLGNKLCSGDDIIFLPSSGIHANGLTLARTIKEKLPDGYSTLLKDGSSYGEALLTPTTIYVDAVRSLFQARVDIHYMANITGHGWRKLMRANREFAHVIETVPKPQPIFDFIQEQSGNNNEEMYGNYNMGAGFAIYVAKEHTDLALKALHYIGCDAQLAGHVEEGQKRVIIEPKNIIFDAQSLSIR